MTPDPDNQDYSSSNEDLLSTSSAGDPDEGISDTDRSSFTDNSPLDPHQIKTKIFNDIVHPHLELPTLCCRIINTPQFQRLRNLKQLGLCYYVYPSACHNRFEHCIGTSYLAGNYCKILKTNQPELGINAKDILCLFVAGLCHDLGHGPFSHTWEHFMKEHNKDYSHEEMSTRLIDVMINDNGLKEAFKNEGLEDRDIIFVKELIAGGPLQRNGIFQGRNPNKYFLYQIVSNDGTKIDVDKFDYIMRDCKQLNVTTAFDYERVFVNSRVFGVIEDQSCPSGIKIADTIDETTKTKIAYRKKISGTLEDLFRGRFSLHQKAYQHRVTKIIEEMVLDGLNAAEPYFKVTGKNGKEYKLSTAYEDPEAFIKLTDSVFEQIVNWGNGGEKAKKIFGDIQQRKLYKYVGHISTTAEKFEESLLDDLQKLNPRIKLISRRINYGKGGENPLNDALFFEKSQPYELFPKQFHQPQREEMCFIVLRPNLTETEPNSNDTEIISMTLDISDNNGSFKEIQNQVKEVLQNYKIPLESE